MKNIFLILGIIGVVCGIIGMITSKPFNIWTISSTLWPMVVVINSLKKEVE